MTSLSLNKSYGSVTSRLYLVRLFLDIFSKTQLDENLKNFKTQPIFSAKLKIFPRKLSFPATLLSKSEIKNSKFSKTQAIFFKNSLDLTQNSIFRQPQLLLLPQKCPKKPAIRSYLLFQQLWIYSLFEQKFDSVNKQKLVTLSFTYKCCTLTSSGAR